MNDADLIDILEKRVDEAGSLRKFCDAVQRQFSPSFISRVLNGEKSMTTELAGLLGYVEADRKWLVKG